METAKRVAPIEAARQILLERFPDALAGFVGGSFNRGEATAYSDIDLVVVFSSVEFAWRESFMFEDWPVEVFVHDQETLHYFYQEVDGRDGIQSLASMIFEGAAITTDRQLAAQLKSWASEVLESQAPEWSEDDFSQQRYAISDLIDDLRDPRNLFEARITIGALHEKLGNFYFRSKGLWSASNKHIPRKLLNADKALEALWIRVFEDAYAGHSADLIELTEKILAPYGGFLFDGYRRNAPPSWRLRSAS